MRLRRELSVILICWLGCAWASAQAQKVSSPLPATQNAIAESDPEDAFLSATRYTNAYFGFELELPPQARLAPIPMPASGDRRIQLLELLGPAPQHAIISISAYEYKGKNWTDAKGILRRELDRDLFAGVEELHGLSKTTIDGHQFYYFETRKGIDQHQELATELNGYVLLMVVQASDAQMLKDLIAACSRLKFFNPQEAAQRAGPEALAYEGPAVSAQHLRELRASPPAERMDPGKIEGNVYRNAELGLRYEFPKGWSIQPRGAVEPAVLRYREKVSGEPLMGPRERDVVKACSRVLFSAWKTKPNDDGEVPYDDFGEVTLSAMPLSCFPSIRFPDDPHDADAVRRFLLGFSFSHPLQRDMNDARTAEVVGKTFVLTHGTVAYKQEGDALSRRISVSMTLTQNRGYLLVWLFAAPHDDELRDIMNARMGFDPDPATMEAKASPASPAKPSVPTSPSIPSALTQSGSHVAPPAESLAAPEPVSDNPVAKSQAEASSAPASDAPVPRPTLLRPGETMQDNQSQGKPVPKKSSQ